MIPRQDKGGYIVGDFNERANPPKPAGDSFNLINRFDRDIECTYLIDGLEETRIIGSG